MRIGVFGGTFDPIHIGHMKAAHAFMLQMKLDRLMVIPDRIPPHKAIAENDDPMLRYHMTKLAFASSPAFAGRVTVSDMELRREGKSYTYHTLTELSELGFSEILLYCGTDMLLTLDSWYRPRDIFALCTIAYAAREDQDARLLSEVEEKKEILRRDFGAKIEDIYFTPIEISSTALRGRIRNGEDVSEYLPPAVDQYIKENHLYQ